MRKNNKIVLAIPETTTQELQVLLDNSFFKQQASIKSKIQTPTDTVVQTNSATPTFDFVFPMILKMRQYRDAPVDLLGPQTLYRKDVGIQLQQFQILCSLMLSPQTKDETTAKCMNRLLDFEIREIAEMENEQFRQLIYEVNYNATKSTRIQEMAQLVLVKGMPTTLEQTLSIKGVGEKIGLLYMQIALGQALGIAVDVNMIRVCNRIPIVREESPSKLRQKLEQIVPHSDWNKVNQILVGFGQQVCMPNGRERCNECALKRLCEYYKNKYELKKIQ